MLNHYLEAMAKQLYDYWFVQFDFPDANGNPYKSSGGKMVWNEKLKREIPEGWKDVCFKDICNVKRGASPRPIDEYMDQSHNGIPWVKISDATSSESPFLTLVKEHIIPEGGRHSVHVSPNTLIVSNSASPGIPKFIEIDACVHDGWLILTGYKEYYRYYFYYIIHMIRHNLLHMASGSIFKNLKTDYLKEYVCLTPPQKVLQDYDKIVHPLMSSLLGKQLEIEELTKERDRLLALFMTGQISVKQLNNDLATRNTLVFIIIRENFTNMKNEIINTVIGQMSRMLDSAELKELRNALEASLNNYDICYAENGLSKSEKESEELLDAFLSAKKIEGCSDKT